MLFGTSGLIDSEKEISALHKLVKILESYKNSLPESPLRSKRLVFSCHSSSELPLYYRRKTLADTQQLIGAARSREIIINIGLPIGLIFARAGKLGDLKERLNHIFQITKEASDNKLIRFIKHYIFGEEKEMLRLLTSE